MQIRQQITNSELLLLSCLLLIFFLATETVFAQKIPTQNSPEILQFGSTGKNPLSLPSDVAAYNNKVYIVDGSNHRIMVYDLQGNFLFNFSRKGTDAGQLNYPVGIDISTNGKVYIADSGNKRIQIFSEKGIFLSQFSVKIGKKTVRPVDLVYHSRSGNIVVSGSNHRIMIFSPKGKLLRKWGNNGINQGEFRYPATISELKDGRIAVVDVLNARVQVFNIDGSISLVVGGWGVLPGQLFRPKGVALDRHGNFYISDSYMNVVQKYSDSGSFTGVLGNKGNPYKMQTPVGMTVYKNRLYVTEMRKNRISVYQLVD